MKSTIRSLRARFKSGPGGRATVIITVVVSLGSFFFFLQNIVDLTIEVFKR